MDSLLQDITRAVQSELTLFSIATVLALYGALLLGFRRIRRLVLAIVQFVSVIALVGSTVAAGVAGYRIGQFFKGAFKLPPAMAPLKAYIREGIEEVVQELIPFIAAAAGSFLGFALAALPLCFIFLLAEIAANTRSAPAR